MFNPFQLNSIWLRPNLQHKSNNFTNRNSWLFIEWSSDNNWKLNLVYNSLFVIFGNPRNWKTVLWPIICQTFITISAVVNVTFLWRSILNHARRSCQCVISTTRMSILPRRTVVTLYYLWVSLYVLATWSTCLFYEISNSVLTYTIFYQQSTHLFQLNILNDRSFVNNVLYYANTIRL